MEKSILVFSVKSSNVCCFIFSLLSLIPGLILFGLNNNKELKLYNLSINQYGLPLKVFNNNYLLYPLFTLYDLDRFNYNKKYFIGTTNQIIFENKKLCPDLLINLDTNTYEFNENSKLYSNDSSITKIEKNMINLIIKYILKHNEDKNINNKFVNDNESWMLSNNDYLDSCNDYIRGQFKNYFCNLLSNIALVNEIIKNNKNKHQLFIVNKQDESDVNSLESINNNANNIFDLTNESDDNSDIIEDDSKDNSINYIETKNKINNKFDFSDLKSLKGFLKKILSTYNINFLNNWLNTFNFLNFINSYNEHASSRSTYVKYSPNVLINYENGSYYLGDVCYGEPNGKGTLHETINNVDYTYNGSFLNGKKHGNGTLTSEDSTYVYDGEFYENTKHGYGQLLNNKTRYSGDFKHNKYDGSGLYCDEYGNVYEGEFKDNKFSGQGQLTFTNEDTYIGCFNKGEFDGKGLLRKGKRKLTKEYIDSNYLNITNSDLSKEDSNSLNIKKKQLLENVQDILNNYKENKNNELQVYDGYFSLGKKSGEGILIIKNYKFEGKFSSDKFIKGIITDVENFLQVKVKIIDDICVLDIDDENIDNIY